MTVDDIKPFGDRILVRPDAKVEKFGLIHVPETVKADNPNYYTMTGVVVKLGDGYREDVWECLNAQCRYQSRRTAGEYCPVCKATQRLAYADSGRHAFDVVVGDRVLFGRFAGRQIEVSPIFGQDFVDFFEDRPNTHSKLLLMREIEVLGVLDDAAVVLPGYQAPRYGKASAGLTPEVTTVTR